MAYIWLLVFWSNHGPYMPYSVPSSMGTYDTYAQCKEAHDAIEKAAPVPVWAWRCVKVPAKKTP